MDSENNIFYQILKSFGVFVEIKDEQGTIVYSDIPEEEFLINRKGDKILIDGEYYYIDQTTININNHNYEIKALRNINKAIFYDVKTNILNTEGFEYHITPLIKEKKDFILIAMDVDNFKKINDTYGHYTGDKVLSFICHVLAKSLRDDDIIARFGGDEFLIAMPLASLEAAYKRMHLITSNLQNRKDFPISLSIGMINYNHNLSYGENFKIVDALLYQSKENGKNQISTDLQGERII